MCVTVFNPSEPCCSDADRRCQACAETDWQNYTWLWEQPQAVAIRRFEGVFPIIGLPNEVIYYDTRYMARRVKMQKGSGCSWFNNGSREFFIHSGTHNSGSPLGEWVFQPFFFWISQLIMTDLDFPGESTAGNPFEDSWHSTNGKLYRAFNAELNRWEWRAGWEQFGNSINSPQYSLRGEFDCEGTNEFWRDDSIAAEDLPVWLTLDHFPEWIRVTRVTT